MPKNYVAPKLWLKPLSFGVMHFFQSPHTQAKKLLNASNSNFIRLDSNSIRLDSNSIRLDSNSIRLASNCIRLASTNPNFFRLTGFANMKGNSKASIQRQERQAALDAKRLRQDASDESVSTRADGNAESWWIEKSHYWGWGILEQTKWVESSYTGWQIFDITNKTPANPTVLGFWHQIKP